jgi:uncharacterized protein (DUF1697 family)
MAASATRRVALIRAIGGATHHAMPLARLCEKLAGKGLKNPSNFLVTGNIFFDSAKSNAACKEIVEDTIKEFGITLDVFVRDAAELGTLVKALPFQQAAIHRPHHVLAIMFDAPLPAAGVAQLGQYEGPEVVRIVGQTVYVDYVEGVGRSKLVPGVVERRLKLPGTSRNWNTILKSLALLRAK